MKEETAQGENLRVTEQGSNLGVTKVISEQGFLTALNNAQSFMYHPVPERIGSNYQEPPGPETCSEEASAGRAGWE